ncbi:glycolate oxidase subunit GlcF [Magnetospira thiophila]
MRTTFSPQQQADPLIREAERILRACVHCGFCTATCPTYLLTGDELDGPRGRIYLIKGLLENAAPPSAPVVRHLDRCLGCLGCTTTCPSSVDFMHLMDQARAQVEARYRRPWWERSLRSALAATLPDPRRFRGALRVGQAAKLFQTLLPSPLKSLLYALPAKIPSAPSESPHPAVNGGLRIALLSGCVQQVLDPAIDAATRRLLTRHGIEVVSPDGAGCCGALALHLGKEAQAAEQARRNIEALEACQQQHGPIDHVILTATGCVPTLKDYEHLFHHDPIWRERAAPWAAKARDLLEVLDKLPLVPVPIKDLPPLACHEPCSLQHGQKLGGLAEQILTTCGFEVRLPKESHICCGAAGTYSLLQPALSRQLKNAKTATLKATNAPIVASGNMGCLHHLERDSGLICLHWVELIDWATGGPKPGRLT